MTDPYPIDDQRQQDRRLALLALYETGKQEKDRDDGSCLKAEELACLVEGGGDQAERAEWQRHLAGCDDCLGRWMALYSVVHPGEGLTGRNGRSSRIRRFFWTGSFLAAAASVVLFLAREPDHGLKSLARQQGQARMSEEIQAAAPPLPLGNKVGPGEAAKRGPGSRRADKGQRITTKQVSGGAGPERRTQALTGKQAPKARLSAMSRDLGRGTWQVMARKGCERGIRSREYWRHVMERVRKDATKEDVSSLLPLLERVVRGEDKSVHLFCTRMETVVPVPVGGEQR